MVSLAIVGSVTKIPLYSDRVEMIGAAKNGIELLQLLTEHIPDIILLDIYMPEMDGWKVLKLKEAILKGARAYIDKLDGSMDEIVEAINSVSDDGFYFNDLIAQEIIIKLRSGKDISSLEDESWRKRLTNYRKSLKREAARVD
ncbi:sporulation initiation phosphotransferase F domain protein [Ostertagia ostertagi]